MGWETKIGQSGMFQVHMHIHTEDNSILRAVLTFTLHQQEATPPPTNVEDDWGDDGEDMDLFVAASQLDQAILTPAPEQVNISH